MLAPLQLAHRLQNAQQQLFGAKAGHHDRQAMASRQCFVVALARHRAHMAGRQDGLHLAAGIFQHARQDGRHPHMAHQQGQVGKPGCQGLLGQHRCGGSRCFKAHRKEHHQLLGMALGDGDHIQRCVDHAHITTRCTHRQQGALAAAGYAQHVAEGAKDDPGLGRQGHGLIEAFGRGHAHRASGPMNQSDRLG